MGIGKFPALVNQGLYIDLLPSHCRLPFPMSKAVTITPHGTFRTSLMCPHLQLVSPLSQTFSGPAYIQDNTLSKLYLGSTTVPDGWSRKIRHASTPSEKILKNSQVYK